MFKLLIYEMGHKNVIYHKIVYIEIPEVIDVIVQKLEQEDFSIQQCIQKMFKK